LAQDLIGGLGNELDRSGVELASEVFGAGGHHAGDEQRRLGR
jgi:hypothetical protein